MLKNCQNAFDVKGIDLMEKGGADKSMIFDTVEQMNIWTKHLHNAKLDEDKSVWSSAWDKLVTSVKNIFLQFPVIWSLMGHHKRIKIQLKG